MSVSDFKLQPKQAISETRTYRVLTSVLLQQTSSSCLSWLRVWCLRASWRGVSPSLSVALTLVFPRKTSRRTTWKFCRSTARWSGVCRDFVERMFGSHFPGIKITMMRMMRMMEEEEDEDEDEEEEDEEEEDEEKEEETFT